MVSDKDTNPISLGLPALPPMLLTQPLMIIRERSTFPRTRRQSSSLAALITVAFLGSRTVHAGMTVYDLNDVVRLRLQDISFFAFLFLLCGWGMKALWNYMARDFKSMPRLNYGRALALTAILSLFMGLVLSMISGARELMTPEAWRKQGHGYKLNLAPDMQTRRRNLEYLAGALQDYARKHDGRLPPHDYVEEILARLWQADSAGTHFIYLPSQTTNSLQSPIAWEPLHFGEPRLVLLGDGSIQFSGQGPAKR